MVEIRGVGLLPHVFVATAIQAILASTDLTAKAKNAAILALSTKPMLPDN